MDVEIVLVRHGESERNLSCDHAREGRPEWLARQMREETEEELWPLTETGRDQARRTGAWIRENVGSAFDVGVCSPYVRARDTAHLLGFDVNWREDERVRERLWGDYCAAGLEPYTVDGYLQHLAECADFTWKTPFPGGERLADLVPRVSEFLHELLAQASARAIVVCHGGTLRAMQMVLERLPEGEHRRMAPVRLSNGCIMQFQLSFVDGDRSRWAGRWRLAQPNIEGAPVSPWRDLAGL